MNRFGIVLDFLDRRRVAALRLALALLVVSAALWLAMPQQTAPITSPAASSAG